MTTTTPAHSARSIRATWDTDPPADFSDELLDDLAGTDLTEIIVEGLDDLDTFLADVPMLAPATEILPAGAVHLTKAEHVTGYVLPSEPGEVVVLLDTYGTVQPEVGARVRVLVLP